MLLKFSTLLFYMFLIGSATAQLGVDFTAVETSGCAPILVEFENLTPHQEGMSYEWDFGNGITSTIQHPKVTFAEPGAYTIKLKAIIGNNEQTLIKDNFITIYGNFEIDFTPSIVEANCAPYEINFTSIVANPDIVNSYTWDFGDGIFSHEANPQHIYQEGGVFSVTLVIENQYGCIGQKNYQNLVRVYKPTSYFEGIVKKACDGQVTVPFTNLSFGLGELEFLWDFGDGNSSNEQNPMHQYFESGSYDVKLITTDEIGCTDTLIYLNYVSVEETLSDFSVQRDTVCPNELITFDNTSINAQKVQWDFGDGHTSSEYSPTHLYDQPGNYLVTLLIDNRECSSTSKKTIIVEEVLASFSIQKNFSCEVPVTINYQNTSTNASTYQWEFGNGNLSTLENPTNTLSVQDLQDSNSMSFTDKLTVTSPNGCKNTITKVDNVTITIPELTIISDKKSGCVPLDVAFEAQTNYPTDKDQVTAYHWTFDGEEVSDKQDWTNSFSQTGAYTIYLSLQTELGCKVSAEKVVKVGEPQIPDFTVKDKNIFCADETVFFTDLSTDQSKIDNIQWEYGDGESSFFGESFHSYQDTGYMDVSLSVYNNGCERSITKKNVLFIQGPIAKFDWMNPCEKSKQVTLQPDFKGVTNTSWDFGDGTTGTSTEEVVTHTYTDYGEYNITLSTENNTNGCTFSHAQTIHLVDRRAVYDTINSTPCINNEIEFDPQRSTGAVKFEYDQSRHLYLWDFGDNSPKLFTDETVRHAYGKAGTYISELVIKDINSCTDTFRVPITVFNPKPAFSSEYKLGCLPFTFLFTDLSEPAADIITWDWNFGDGSTSDLKEAEHDYINFGQYDVTLKVTDIHGCSSLIKKTKEVSVEAPDASFKASDTTLCINQPVLFEDNSKSFVESFEWDFGNGSTSNERTPQHAYDKDGNYDVSLKIIDDHGCPAEKVSNAFITVQKPPVAQFMADQVESNCYPFPVNFTDQSFSDYLGNWKWSFGDNQSTSTLADPKHIYTKPGTYDVTLIAGTTNGCTDTITKANFITIGGPYADIQLNDTACIYDQVHFSLANAQNIGSIVWDFGDGTISEEMQTWHTYDKDGFIYPSLLLKTNSSFACDKIFKDTLYIDQVHSKIGFSDGYGVGCVPYSIQFVNESDYSDQWNWLIDDTPFSTDREPDYLFNLPGDYTTTLIAASNFGCKDTSQVEITVHPLPTITLSKDTFICKDASVLIWAKGGVQYYWMPDAGLDDPTIDNPIASPETSTTYTVVVTDNNDCINSDSLVVKVQQPAQLSIIDTTIIIGETVQMDIQQADIQKYLWSPDQAISCIDCFNPQLNPVETTQYTVQVTDTAECFTVEFPFTVMVEKKYSLDVPSAFTPNGDGINDKIFVKGWGIKELINIQIYNSYGETVYQSNAIHESWDGTYKGASQPAGTFNYIVEVLTYENKRISKKGRIELIR
ncbi:MAG: PKD domain-containing protein [Marinilabiliaceae bacterium]|nr:PKD domain-containing protein [Marinilabiliaceae bacterium]